MGRVNHRFALRSRTSMSAPFKKTVPQRQLADHGVQSIEVDCRLWPRFTAEGIRRAGHRLLLPDGNLFGLHIEALLYLGKPCVALGRGQCHFRLERR